MLSFIKQKLPTPFKKILISIKQKTYDNWQKRLLYKRMRLKHAKLLTTLREKDRIKVIFLVLHKSVWKVDPLFKKMLADPFFEPLIFVCPYTSISEEDMREDIIDINEYFSKKGYPVTSAYIEKEKRWQKLDEHEPDIVFFTNPYKLTKFEYYEEAYKNYLCCYVPYYFMATTHAGNLRHQLNAFMLNSMWKIYWPHRYILEKFSKHSVTKGENSLLTGYPATEVFLKTSSKKKQVNTAWKSQGVKKKKIIYAPHHTIENTSSSLSTFLQYGNFIKQLSKECKDKIQWSFKPHPMLKEKLFSHPDWGVKRTNEYYKSWQDSPNTQLDLGGYDELFSESDALIHDCSSFIAEYSFTRKPALYLVKSRDQTDSFLNLFGKRIFESHRKAICKQDILDFICNIANEREALNRNTNVFFDNYLKELYIDKTPSQRIIEDIKSELNK